MARKETDPFAREMAILDEIIQYYVAHHEAISARTLSKISSLALSPTTIRNLMEDLSADGFLTAEGVTRGRIPTQKAFAIYVTRLDRRKVQPKQPPPQIAVLEEGRTPTLAEVLDQVGRFLAAETGCVVLAELPPRDRYPINWVRLVSTPGDRVLVVLQTLYGDLWSKLLVAGSPFPEGLLEEVTRFINGRYHGHPSEQVRADIMSGEPKELLADMPSLGAAFRMLRKAFEWDDTPSSRVWGRQALFDLPEVADAAHLKALDALLQRSDLVSGALASGRVVDEGRVAIGTETGLDVLENFALVGFPFGRGRWQGMLAVLGPMRLEYPSVVGLTAQSARALSDHLAGVVRETAAPPEAD